MRVRVWFIGARTHACTHARMCNCVALGLAAQCVWSISGEERAMGPRVFRLLPGQRESAREPHLQGTMRKRPAMVLCVCWGNRVNSGHVRDRIPFSCFRLFLLSHVSWTSYVRPLYHQPEVESSLHFNTASLRIFTLNPLTGSVSLRCRA